MGIKYFFWKKKARPHEMGIEYVKSFFKKNKGDFIDINL